MTSSQEFGPNERLQRARSLKGWSQAELAEQVGTSFEIVSRWERGITIPNPYYRQRLCAVLGQSAEELGLLGNSPDAWTSLPSPFVFLASSHVDADKPIIFHLKTALQERGVALLSSRQLSRQGNGNARTSLREFVQAAQVILVIISPAAASSRHVREAMEWAGRYQRPVCGVWIEGEHWQEYLPKGTGEVAALLDARTSDDPALIEEIATSLQRVGWSSAPENGRPTFVDAEGQGDAGELATASQEFQIVSPPSQHNRQPATAATQVPTDMPLLPPRQHQHSGPPHRRTWMLVGLVVLVIAGTLFGSVSLLAHFGVLGAHSTPPAQGGTWTDDLIGVPDSFIPNESALYDTALVDQALYLPLFYGDAQGVVHPGAAIEMPTVQNGSISADARTWTFHLRSNLVWSDGQPYDARDVDYTWRLWTNPKFGAAIPLDPTLISRVEVSADHLSITFHLTRADASFLQYWVDGYLAPLPQHYFSSMAPEAIKKSSINLNPKVTSGPFLMEESVPDEQYTLVRNPNYYRASEGLPYLGKVVFRVVNPDTFFKDLQAGLVDSSWNLDVRQAMAMAIDHQALINVARRGFASLLCTDHGLALLPGYEAQPPCPEFNPAAANQLLDEHGWTKGADGVRIKGGERLEFEYSTTNSGLPASHLADEAIIQHNMQLIGIKLDIQNYPQDIFFGSFLPNGKASPPTGAISGRYGIAELSNTPGYDPDDAYLFACDQFPPTGYNISFYCNHTLDALYQQEQMTADAGLRQQFFVQIHRIYLTEFPFIVLYSPIDLSIVRKGTHNYQPGPLGALETINIAEWWCDSGKC